MRVMIGMMALLLAGAAQAAVPPGVSQASRAVPGVAAPVEIIVDRAGIPHIFAASAHDAFFAQGWQVARDRLWQIDLWRKRGLGRLAASFGPGFVAQDRASRLLLYRGDMAAEWAAYAPEAKEWTTAFVAGINAYIAATAAGTAPLPQEFSATASQPERWDVDDVVRIRSNGLTRNVDAEVARARALCGNDGQYDQVRQPLTPAHVLHRPKGLDVCSIPADVLADYDLGTASVRFDSKQLVERLDPERQEGSNNWVVAPARSTTGRPILANDPHREHQLPSLRYLVHLDAPGLQLAGAGEPALPGISFGHNGRVAWGLTIFNADQQDLVVNPAGAATTRVTERIEVKGEAPRDVVLEFTTDGPIIHRDAASGRSFALRATWALPGAAAYFQATRLFKAGNWQDFLTARQAWGAPNLNLVFASPNGDIGWAPGGAVPDRAAGDGLLPVPAGKAYRWRGLQDAALLPQKFNPAAGWVATANEMNLPAGFPFTVGYEWTDRSRIDRISEVLAAKPQFGITDAMALQTDVTSPLARSAVALLAGLQGRTDDERAGLALLAGWDARETADSAAAALYEIWASRHLPRVAVANMVPPDVRANWGAVSAASVVPLLAAPSPLLGKPQDGVAQAILLESLGAAVAEARTLLGADMADWRWGRIHRALFRPALGITGRDAERSVGPLPLGGSGSTPMAASYRRGSFDLSAGASVRLVVDVGAWDNTMVVNSPGQSGDPASPHYRDLFVRWQAGQYVPFRFSRAMVEQDAERVETLLPQP